MEIGSKLVALSAKLSAEHTEEESSLASRAERLVAEIAPSSPMLATNGY